MPRGLGRVARGGVFLLLIVFPLGTLSSPAMRRFAVLVLLDFAAIWFIIATSSKLEAPLKAFDNPLVLTTSDLYAAALAIPLVVACLVSIVAAAVILGVCHIIAAAMLG